LTNEFLNTRSAATISFLSLSFLDRTKETSLPVEQCEILAVRNFQEAAQKQLRSSLKSSALFVEEKKPKRQQFRILILKKTKSHSSTAYTCRDGSDPNCRAGYAAPSSNAATPQKVVIN